MPIDKEASRRWRARLREVFMAEWDPIGVKGVPDAQDEYDAYVGKVAAMLRESATDDQLFDYLHSVETAHMGLRGDAARVRQTIVAIRALGFMN